MYGKVPRKLSVLNCPSPSPCHLLKDSSGFTIQLKCHLLLPPLQHHQLKLTFPISLPCPGSANSANARGPRTNAILQAAVEAACLWSPNWRELEVGRSGTQGHSQLLREFEASLDQLGPCLREDRKWGGRKSKEKGKEEKE